jgi:hypothetical protein
MIIDKNFTRRILIQGRPEHPTGRFINVRDVDTGQAITNVCRIVITLDVRQVNKAVVTYWKSDESGHVIPDDNGDPVQETIAIKDPEVRDVVAFESAPLLDAIKEMPERDYKHIIQGGDR